MLEQLGIQVERQLHSVQESIEWFSTNEHPDLIFLDIQLADGLSFEIFDEVEVKSTIVFTTAYDEYALQAFKLNSIDYLLKPIDEDELTAAVRKFRETRGDSGALRVDFEDIRKLLENPIDRRYKKRYTAQVGAHIKVVPVEEVSCFYSQDKGTYGATASGRNFLLDTTMEQLEKELSPESFFRVSRKFIVQLSHIKDIVAYSNSRLRVEVVGHKELDIIVSRERVKDFKLWLE